MLVNYVVSAQFSYCFFPSFPLCPHRTPTASLELVFGCDYIISLLSDDYLTLMFS